jgi:hypothetical protein
VDCSYRLFTGWQRAADRSENNVSAIENEQLTVKQTATGYWVVRRGAVELAGAVTRQAAEAERELMRRLGDRSSHMHPPRRRAARRARRPPR